MTVAVLSSIITPFSLKTDRAKVVIKCRNAGLSGNGLGNVSCNWPERLSVVVIFS